MTRVCLPGTTRVPCSSFASARYRMSLTRVDFPDPQVCAGQRVRAVEQVLQRAGDHDIAAVLARPRADVDHPVGGADGVLVVLDHDQRVAEVAEPGQGLQQPVVVALVQPDGRLVEHVQHADQARADLRGQPDPLRLPPGQRRRRPVQGQVVQPHVEQEAEPGVDLLEDPAGDLLVPVGQLEFEQALGQLADGQRAELGDGLAVHGHRKRYRLQPGSPARQARHLAHEPGVTLPAGIALRLGMPPLDVGDRTLDVRVVGALPAVPVLVPDVYLVAIAAQQGVAGGGGQLGPGRVGAEPEGIAERLDQPHEVVADLPAAPGADRAPGQGPIRIRDHELGVDLHPRAQARAVGARAPRGVERERPRLELVERQVVIQARQVLGEHPLPMRVVLRKVHEVEDHHPARQGQRRLHRVGQPPPGRLLHRQPVHHHLDVMLLVLLQRRQLAPGPADAVQPDDSPVHPGPGVALGLQLAQHLLVLALAPPHHRRQHLKPRPLRQLQHPVHDLLRALPRDRPPAHRAVRPPHPRVQQPQVVIHLGDRAHRRAGVAARRLLVDRHRRRQPVDEIHIGLVHLPQELPGIRRQRLHIPALPLGEDRVKRQARLPRPRQPGEHDQRITRQVQRHVLQVVLTRTTDNETRSAVTNA